MCVFCVFVSVVCKVDVVHEGRSKVIGIMLLSNKTYTHFVGVF